MFLGECKGYWCISTLGSVELHWHRAESASDASILFWLLWQKTVTIPRFSSPTPSVIRITIGVASLLVLRLILLINSTQSSPHMSGDAKWAKSLSEISLKQRASKSGSSQSDVHSCSENSQRRDGSSSNLL